MNREPEQKEERITTPTSDIQATPSAPPKTQETSLFASSAPTPEEFEPRSRMALYVGLGAVALLGVLVAWLALSGSNPVATNTGQKGPDEDIIKSVRETLAGQRDQGTCQQVLEQINTHFNQHAELRPEVLPAQRRDHLGKLFGLDGNALDEITGNSYTSLDSFHLYRCFLFRDALSVLQPTPLPSESPDREEAILDLVTRGFAWTTRQVQVDDHPFESTPPAYALRRGLGSPLERALVFLALCEQIDDVTGCLVYCPDAEGEMRLWACGIHVEGSPDVHLFDPRLGLPVPGPGGRGVATLAQAVADAEVLGQLTIDRKDYPYDVTAEQAGKAELHAVCSLSSLAPRIRYLEEKVLPPIKVRLAVDPDRMIETLEAAAKVGDKVLPVRAWQEKVGPQGQTLPGPTVLQRFLPADQGGVNQTFAVTRQALAQLGFIADPGALPGGISMNRLQIFEFTLVPWLAMPEKFQDEHNFPINVGLGQQIRQAFARPFMQYVLEPNHARDYILRGRFNLAAELLIDERDEAEESSNRLRTATNLSEGVDRWVEQARPLYAELQRALNRRDKDAEAEARRKIEELWKGQTVRPVVILLAGYQAGPRLATLTYLLAQLKHEEAEHAQVRAAVREGRDRQFEAKQAQQAWGDAAVWSDIYLRNYPDGKDAATVRRLRARQLVHLERGDEAISLLEDTSDLTKLEATGVLYLARRLKQDQKAAHVPEGPEPTRLAFAGDAQFFIAADLPPLPAGKKVTLPGERMPLSKALAEVERQTGIRVEDRRETGDTEIQVDAAESLFWEAVDRIARAGEANVYVYPGSGRIVLTRAQGPHQPGRITYSGPFRISLKEVATRLNLESGGRTTSATFEAAWEPSLQAFYLETRPQNLRIADDRGQAVAAPDTGHSQAPVDGRTALVFDAPLPAIPRATQGLASVEGELTAIVPSKMLQLSFAMVDALHNAAADDPLRTIEREGVTCSITKVTLTSDRWTFQVSLNIPPGDAEFDSFQSWVVNNEMTLRKKDGQVWKSSSYVLDANSARGAVVSYHFLHKDAPAPPQPADWSLTYTTPAALLQMPIRFAFKDIPLP
jgi:hypothetical protein